MPSTTKCSRLCGKVVRLTAAKAERQRQLNRIRIRSPVSFVTGAAAAAVAALAANEESLCSAFLHEISIIARRASKLRFGALACLVASGKGASLSFFSLLLSSSLILL